MTPLDRLDQLPTGTWTMDPAHTTVRAAVRKLLIVDAPASLELVEGSIRVDDDGQVAEIVAVLDAASYESGNVQRDAWATGPACLDAERHPHLTFRSRDVRIDADRSVAIGTVAVRGVDHPIMIEVSDARVQGDTAAVRADLVLDRQAVGLGSYPSVLIARRIPISISVTARLANAAKPSEERSVSSVA
ncbi:MAG: YceI family protein [Actinomycetota bacterium]